MKGGRGLTKQPQDINWMNLTMHLMHPNQGLATITTLSLNGQLLTCMYMYTKVISMHTCHAWCVYVCNSPLAPPFPMM